MVLYAMGVDVCESMWCVMVWSIVKMALMRHLNVVPLPLVHRKNSNVNTRNNAFRRVSFVTEIQIVATKVMKWKIAPNAPNFDATMAFVFNTIKFAMVCIR